MFNLMQTAAIVRQYTRALTGDSVVIGDVIRLAASVGGGTAIVLDTRTADMHVTGFYEDGERWHEIVPYNAARHATPRQIARLQAVAPALEIDLIAMLCAANIAAQGEVWQAAS
jgi:hypothetical protein